MVKWIAEINNHEGFDRNSLIELYESTRKQRNTHRSVIFDHLQFYVTVVSALLGFAVTLTAFGLPHIADSSLAGPMTISLFGICILSVPVAGWLIVGHALKSTEKEYQKLAEYLTVEQKLESVLGLDRPITIQFDLTEDGQIFPDDTSLLYDRWVKSRMQRNSTGFVDTQLESREGLHVPLAGTLRILRGLNAIVFLAIAVIHITTVVPMLGMT
ncbi:MAG: hypothetical protein ABIK83_09545 [Candidatus Zixiibacteriota bacterium]